MRYVLYMSNGTNMVTNATVLGSHLYRRDLQLGTNLLIDVDTNGAGSVDVSGAGFSMSPDGRFIAFSAQDGSWVAGDTNRAFDIFLRDTLNGTTELISVPDPSVPIQSGAAFSSLSQTALSQDGHWLVFTSAAGDLVTNDSNGDLDVFVRDLTTGSNFLVSVAANGVAGLGGPSFNPVISADGRFVTFVSAATNLVAGDTNIAADIFLRDMLLQTTTQLDVDTAGTVLGNGDASAPALSQDGRYSVFLCRTNYPVVSYSVFWRDAVSNQTILLTNNSTTNIAPSISADGRFVAYGNNFSQLFVWDAVGGTNIYTNNFNAGGAAISPSGTKLLYSIPQNILHQTVVTDLATKSNLFSFLRTTPVRSPAQWSGDGRYFAFVWTTNGIPGDTNGTNDVYLCDTQTGTLTLVSMNAARTASGNGVSDSPAVSGDGRFVVFRSLATDIITGATNIPNLFVFDRLTGSNTLITIDQVNTSWNPWTAKPAISGSGGGIAFQSYRSGIVPFDLNLVQDVFAAPQTTWPVTDADGDGIPDAWTQQYFGHPLGQAGDLSRAQDDADGDGLSNLQEYLTGTNPIDFNSALRLTIAATVSNNTVTLNWPGAPGKSYKVQFKSSLTDAQWVDLGGSASVLGNQGSFTTTEGQAGYFRVLGVN
jgi:Tol biopolymer transport system component